MYPKEGRLDSTLASLEIVEAQVLLLNRLEDRQADFRIPSLLSGD